MSKLAGKLKDTGCRNSYIGNMHKNEAFTHMAGNFNVLSHIIQAMSISTQSEHQNLYDKFFFLLLSKAGL